jgi:hypothetical protein
MRLVIYAGANQGIRVVDFRDPTNPKEIAYYNAARHTTTPATGQDFTRPDARYDVENCMIYTGWNQAGLKILELTSPEYNPCMRRATSGFGLMTDTAGGTGKSKVSFNAKRSAAGFGALEGTLQLSNADVGAEIRISQLTSLGSVRDRCGSVPAKANAVQFEGTGTYNGSNASFRVCVQDGATNAAHFQLACTAGCSFSTGGTIGMGSIQVRQQ